MHDARLSNFERDAHMCMLKLARAYTHTYISDIVVLLARSPYSVTPCFSNGKRQRVRVWPTSIYSSTYIFSCNTIAIHCLRIKH